MNNSKVKLMFTNFIKASKLIKTLRNKLNKRRPNLYSKTTEYCWKEIKEYLNK